MFLDSSSDSDKSLLSKKEWQFHGIFDQENKTQNKTNNHETKDVQRKRKEFQLQNSLEFFHQKYPQQKKHEKTQKEKAKKKINLMSRV